MLIPTYIRVFQGKINSTKSTLKLMNVDLGPSLWKTELEYLEVGQIIILTGAL